MAANTKTQKHRNAANPEFSKAMHALRSSSATQKHDNRPNRQRSRSAAKGAAIRNSGY